MIALTSAPVLAAGRHAGRAALWIGGWIVVLAVLVTLVVYVLRGRDRRSGRRDGR